MLKYFFILLIVISGCSKTYYCNDAPFPYYFVLLNEDHTPYFSDTTQAPKMFYLDKGDTVYLNDIGLFNWPTKYKFILSTRLAPRRSADRGVKNFYLKLPDGDIDSLYLDYGKNEKGDPSCGGCCRPYRSSWFNGKEPQHDQTTAPDVWVLIK